MLHNKNIILNILTSHFWDDIVKHVSQYVIDMESNELERIFNDQIDYAELVGINQMQVVDYTVEREEHFSGILRVDVEMEGFSYWDKEDYPVGFSDMSIVFLFSFCVTNRVYTDFDLVNLV
ncbi:MAG: hypothetical protein ACI4TF_14815 [Oliverpabstia sp.]